MAENENTSSVLLDIDLREKYSWMPKPGKKLPAWRMRELTANARQGLREANDSLEFIDVFLRVVEETESWSNALDERGEWGDWTDPEQRHKRCTSFKQFLDIHLEAERKRFSKAAKLEYVEMLINGGLSTRAVAAQAGVSQSTASRVQRKLAAEGSESNDSDGAGNGATVTSLDGRKRPAKGHSKGGGRGSKGGAVTPPGDAGGSELRQELSAEMQAAQEKLRREQVLFTLEGQWVNALMGIEREKLYVEAGYATMADYVRHLDDRLAAFETAFAQKRGNSETHSRQRISDAKGSVFGGEDETKPPPAGLSPTSDEALMRAAAERRRHRAESEGGSDA